MQLPRLFLIQRQQQQQQQQHCLFVNFLCSEVKRLARNKATTKIRNLHLMPFSPEHRSTGQPDYLLRGTASHCPIRQQDGLPLFGEITPSCSDAKPEKACYTTFCGSFRVLGITYSTFCRRWPRSTSSPSSCRRGTRCYKQQSIGSWNAPNLVVSGRELFCV